MDPRIRIVLRAIEEQNQHDCSRLSLTMMRNLLGLSPTRLRRLFKLEVGKPLHQYLLEVKMARAACLVKRYELSIKNIAYRCGYDDLSNFYRDFRKVHAMTPWQLRARQLQLVSHTAELLHDLPDSVRGTDDRDDARPEPTRSPQTNGKDSLV
jgi:AraC-like DNA-binding protein